MSFKIILYANKKSGCLFVRLNIVLGVLIGYLTILNRKLQSIKEFSGSKCV